MSTPETIRFGKRKTINSTTFAVSLVDQAIGGLSTVTTVMVRFSVQSGGDAWINFGAAAVVGTGIKIPGAGQPVDITVEDFGPSAMANIHVIGTVAASMGIVIVNTNDQG